MSKVKQLSSILQISDSNKDSPFTPRKNTQPQMECLALIIFLYCFLHHSKEKTIRTYLYHWGKMKIILKSFSFAYPHLGGLSLSYYPSKGIPVLMEQKRESLFASFFPCNNRISFICLITALEETSNWILVESFFFSWRWVTGDIINTNNSYHIQISFS